MRVGTIADVCQLKERSEELMTLSDLLDSNITKRERKIITRQWKECM